jgi:signal peptidase II
MAERRTRTASGLLPHGVFLVVGGLLVALDQWSKYAVTVYFERGARIQPIRMLGGLFHITYTENTGAAFGVLAGETVSWLLLIISLLALVFVAWYYWMYRDSLWMRLALTLIAAGAVGNFIDRVRLRYVVDFIDVDIGAYQWPYFNLADSLISVGATMLVLHILVDRVRRGHREGVDDAT